jgi:hypothetical protein
MAKARFDIPTQLPSTLTRPIQAGVGVTDRVVAVVREALTDMQKRAAAVQKDVQKTVSGLDYQPQALREQATRAMTARIDALGKEAQGLPVRLQKLVDIQVATAETTYDELVKRGETLVGRIRRQPSTAATTKSAKTTTAKAKTTRTQATKTAKTAKKSATSTTKKAAKSPARSSAKATATAAKKTASDAAQATTDAAQKLGD